MIFVPHLLAILIVIFLVPVLWLLKLGLATLIVLSLLYFFQLHVYQKLSNSVISIQQDSANNWFVTTLHDNGQAVQRELLASSFVSPYLIILNFSGSNSLLPYTALVPPGSLPEKDFRRLRVRLKTMKKKK